MNWILLFPVLHLVRLAAQDNFCAPCIWIKQIQYSDISFIYMLSNLENAKRNATTPGEGTLQKIWNIY